MADPEQLNILKQGVDAWNRYRRPGDKIDLSGSYLHAAELPGADLREADLREADLRWAKLRGADLLGAKLLGAKLQGADCRTVINEAGEREFTDLSRDRGSDAEAA
jgi:uncharacterized protein YjbI with pentapeptide repeats